MLHVPITVSPSANFWLEVATTILQSKHLLGQQLQSKSYDFSSCQIIVPASAHIMCCRTGFIQAMKNLSWLNTTFILPKISILQDQLPKQDLTQIVPNSIRVAQLYTKLRVQKKLVSITKHTSNLLLLTQTLLQFTDELIKIILPKTQNNLIDINTYLDNALSTRFSQLTSNIFFNKKKLILSIFKKQFRSATISKHFFCMLKLIHSLNLRQVIWIHAFKLTSIEEFFIKKYSEHTTVQPITLDWSGKGIPKLYKMAWPELTETNTLFFNKNVTKKLHNKAKLGFQLCVTKNFEDMIEQSADIILNWLNNQGKNRIAIVAQDQLSSHRLEIALKRAAVFANNTINIKLSSTSAASVLITWCELVTRQGEVAFLLNFLKSPFVFSNLEDKNLLIMEIEQKLSKIGITKTWHDILMFFKKRSHVTHILHTLEQQAVICNSPKTLFHWNAYIQQLLNVLSIRCALEQDSCGQQILHLLHSLNFQTKTSIRKLFSFNEFSLWLKLCLDTIDLAPLNIDKRVTIIPLKDVRLRNFDAVLVLGLDATSFPIPNEDTLGFSDSIRHQLGLSTSKCAQQQLRDFVELLCTHKTIVLSYYTHKANEINPENLWLERLKLCLPQAQLTKLNAHSQYTPPLKPYPNLELPGIMPSPSAKKLTPAQLSASAFDCLLACPYKFFALYMLGLKTTHRSHYSFLNQKDYGGLVHKILSKYHTTIRDTHTPHSKRAAVLRKISNTMFKNILNQHPDALHYAILWKKTIPVYLDWANEREAKGWHFQDSEITAQKTLPLDTGNNTIKLHGKLDRIDSNNTGDEAILDYKIYNARSLSSKLKLTDSCQLLFYSLLRPTSVTTIHYVNFSTSPNRVDEICITDLLQKKQALQHHISTIIQQIRAGAPMPANGIRPTCEHCSVRGLCRKQI